MTRTLFLASLAAALALAGAPLASADPVPRDPVPWEYCPYGDCCGVTVYVVEPRVRQWCNTYCAVGLDVLGPLNTHCGVIATGASAANGAWNAAADAADAALAPSDGPCGIDEGLPAALEPVLCGVVFICDPRADLVGCTVGPGVCEPAEPVDACAARRVAEETDGLLAPMPGGEVVVPVGSESVGASTHPVFAPEHRVDPVATPAVPAQERTVTTPRVEEACVCTPPVVLPPQPVGPLCVGPRDLVCVEDETPGVDQPGREVARTPPAGGDSRTVTTPPIASVPVFAGATVGGDEVLPGGVGFRVRTSGLAAGAGYEGGGIGPITLGPFTFCRQGCAWPGQPYVVREGGADVEAHVGSKNVGVHP